MNKRQFPIHVLNNIKPLMQKVRLAEREFSNLILATDFYDAFVNFVDINDQELYFRIHNYKINEAKDVFYLISVNPADEFGTIISKEQMLIQAVLEQFELWIDLVQKYDAINFDLPDVLIQQYEEEIYYEFEIKDKDAETNAFNPDQQEFLYKFLDELEVLLISNASEEVSNTLIEETKLLKGDIQNLTKQQFLKRFASLFAKIKKSGLDLLAVTLDVAKKEVIKTILHAGAKHGGTFIESVIQGL